jgi:hypothetical protein
VGTVMRREPSGEWVMEAGSPEVDHLEVRDFWTHEGELLAVGRSVLPMGPWMAFPKLLNPAPEQFMDHNFIEWSEIREDPAVQVGPDPTYNTVYINSSDGFTVWQMTVAGTLSKLDLPPLGEVVGYDPIIEGQKYLSLSRALNPKFLMTGYRSNQTSMWRRLTWSSGYGTFY